MINKSPKEIFGFGCVDEGSEKTCEARIYFHYVYDFLDVLDYSKFYQLPLDDAFIIEDRKLILKYPSAKRQIVEGLYDYLKNVYLKYKAANKESVDTEKMEYKFGESKLILSDMVLYQGDSEELKIGYQKDCYFLEK